MSLQISVPTSKPKALRTRTRQRYAAARAFYLTILVISAIALLSLLNEGKIHHDTSSVNHALFSRTHLTISHGLLHGRGGELVRRDQAVRYSSFGVDVRKDFHEAHNPLHSADSSTRLKTNALSSAPTAQMRKQVSFPTYNFTIASCTRRNLSPSSSWLYGSASSSVLLALLQATSFA